MLSFDLNFLLCPTGVKNPSPPLFLCFEVGGGVLGWNFDLMSISSDLDLMEDPTATGIVNVNGFGGAFCFFRTSWAASAFSVVFFSCSMAEVGTLFDNELPPISKLVEFSSLVVVCSLVLDTEGE